MAYLVRHGYLVGNEAIDAIGATEDRREELERQRDERTRCADRTAGERRSWLGLERP